jgi:hypothetical protein
MSQEFLPESQFVPQEIREIGIRFNDIEYACGLQHKADEIRHSKVSLLANSALTPEEQAAAAQSGIYPGSVDILAWGINGIKELRARSLERTANGILED